MKPLRILSPATGFALFALLVTSAGSATAQDPSIVSAMQDVEGRHIGPVNMGGRVSAIVGIPGDPRTFWVGGADGGVWKTSNHGMSWSPLFDDEALERATDWFRSNGYVRA